MVINWAFMKKVIPQELFNGASVVRTSGERMKINLK